MGSLHARRILGTLAGAVVVVVAAAAGLGVSVGSSSESWPRRWPERVSESGLGPGCPWSLGGEEGV